MLLGQLLAGCGLLLLTAVAMRLLASLFDHDVVLLAIGAALGACGAGLALAHGFVPVTAREFSIPRVATALMVAGLTAAGVLVILLSRPLGSVWIYLLLLAGFSVPFAAWAFGMAFVARLPGTRVVRMAWLSGAAVGLMLSSSAVEWLEGPLRLGWSATIMLGASALLVAGRRATLGLGIGVAMVWINAGYFLSAGSALEPAWPSAGYLSARPLYGQLRSGGLAAEPETRWSAAHRTDRLIYQGREQELHWLFTDATAPIPTASNRFERDIAWFKQRFPLLAIPILVSEPTRLLTVGSLPGVEVELALRAGVREIRGLAYNQGAEPFLIPESTTRTPSDPSEMAMYFTQDIRGGLGRLTEEFDQIVLPVTHVNIRNRVASNLADRDLYSIEAFRDYWQRLRAGGLLVVTTADERLFARSVLTVWSMLETRPEVVDKSPAMRSWGIRMLPGATLQGPYQYLLIVAKGEVADDLPLRIRQALQDLPVDPLFGPGMAHGQAPAVTLNQSGQGLFGRAQQARASRLEAQFGSDFLATRHYAALYQSGGLDNVEEELTRLLSRDVGYWVDIRPATDQRPGFFAILPGQRPEQKWLFTATLLVLVGIVLFAQPSQRRTEDLDARRGPALALYLVYFGLLSGTGVMTTVGLLDRALRLPGLSLEGQGMLLAALLAGAVLALWPAPGRRAGRYGTAMPLLVVLVLAAVLYWLTGPGYAAIVGWPLMLKWLLVAVCALSLGAALARACDTVLHRLATDSPTTLPWVWLMLGGAALGGVVLAQWWALAWGWGAVWFVLCGAWALLLVAGSWLWPGLDDQARSPAASSPGLASS